MVRIPTGADVGNNLILERLHGDSPFLAGRFGRNEFYCFNGFIRSNNCDKDIKGRMCREAGFFPKEDWAFKKYAELMVKGMPLIDLLASCGTIPAKEEGIFINKYCGNQMELSKFRCLEPYYHSNPWSQALKGKKVLIIHPFEKSIRSQYNKRKLLFLNPLVLPKFNLDVLPAVQSIAGTKTNYETWFDAYDAMCSDISKKDFDVAIVGAGAYGLPLSFFVKSIGKKVVQMGGATQIFFGIKGKRWDTHDVISKFYNKNWVRPSASETPANFKAAECGAYW